MAASESSVIAVLAEKPSVARDIARVLGATSKGDGYLRGNGYVVTWAVGHLAALAQPHEINPEWRHWRRDLLPILPDHWPLVVYEKTKDQFEVVRRVLTSPRISSVVCATDAGREGELIFRYIYEAAQCGKPVSRLWISSLTPDAIRKGFEVLRPGSDYDPLADAARGAQPGRLAGGHEPFARILARLRRRAVGGTRADSHAGHVGGARACHTALCVRRLSGNRSQLPPYRRHEREHLFGHMVPSAA